MQKALAHLFKIEMLLHFRRSQDWLHPLTFFLMVICMFPLALSPEADFLQHYMPGCIWIAALLASLLSIENLFRSDLEDDFLEQLMLSPMPLAISILPKLLAGWLFTQLPIILLTPLLSWLFHFNFATSIALALSLLLGTPILFLLAAFTVSLTIGLQQHGVLLGLLILPLSVPVLIFGVNIVQEAAANFSIATPVFFLAGISLLAMLLLPIAIAASLRISLDT